jgi:hypothetical protein
VQEPHQLVPAGFLTGLVGHQAFGHCHGGVGAPGLLVPLQQGQQRVPARDGPAAARLGQPFGKRRQVVELDASQQFAGRRLVVRAEHRAVQQRQVVLHTRRQRQRLTLGKRIAPGLAPQLAHPVAQAVAGARGGGVGPQQAGHTLTRDRAFHRHQQQQGRRQRRQVAPRGARGGLQLGAAGQSHTQARGARRRAAAVHSHDVPLIVVACGWPAI